MNVAVFCSANNDIAPDYFRAAEELFGGIFHEVGAFNPQIF